MRESLHMVLFQSSSFIEDEVSESLLNIKFDISGYYLGRGLCPTLRGVDRKLGGWRSTLQGAQQEIEELESHLFKILLQVKFKAFQHFLVQLSWPSQAGG